MSLKEKKSILLEELRHARQGIITAAKRFRPSDVDIAFVGSKKDEIKHSEQIDKFLYGA